MDERPEERYRDMRALGLAVAARRRRRGVVGLTLALAPYARALLWTHVAAWIATLALAGLRSPLWIVAAVLGVAGWVVAMLGIAGRQRVRGETVGTWLPYLLLGRVRWWLRVDDRDRRTVGQWRVAARAWPPPTRFGAPLRDGRGAADGVARPFVHRADEAD